MDREVEATGSARGSLERISHTGTLAYVAYDELRTKEATLAMSQAGSQALAASHEYGATGIKGQANEIAEKLFEARSAYRGNNSSTTGLVSEQAREQAREKLTSESPAPGGEYATKRGVASPEKDELSGVIHANTEQQQGHFHQHFSDTSEVPTPSSMGSRSRVRFDTPMLNPPRPPGEEQFSPGDGNGRHMQDVSSFLCLRECGRMPRYDVCVCGSCWPRLKCERRCPQARSEFVQIS